VEKVHFLASGKDEKQDLNQKGGKEGGHVRGPIYMLYARFEMAPVSFQMEGDYSFWERVTASYCRNANLTVRNENIFSRKKKCSHSHVDTH